jgi:hypothetical protein
MMRCGALATTFPTGVAAVLHLVPDSLPALAPLEWPGTDDADLLGTLAWWSMGLSRAHPLPAGHYLAAVGFSAALYASSVR